MSGNAHRSSRPRLPPLVRTSPATTAAPSSRVNAPSKLSALPPGNTASSFSTPQPPAPRRATAFTSSMMSVPRLICPTARVIRARRAGTGTSPSSAGRRSSTSAGVLPSICAPASLSRSSQRESRLASSRRPPPHDKLADPVNVCGRWSRVIANSRSLNSTPSSVARPLACARHWGNA